MECEEHKRSMKLLNNKLLKNQEVMGQPQNVVKLHEEIRILKTTLAKLVNGTNNLNKLLLHCRSFSDKSRNGYDGVRQVASDILRRGVELRYCKLFPQLKFYFNFNASYKFP